MLSSEEREIRHALRAENDPRPLPVIVKDVRGFVQLVWTAMYPGKATDWPDVQTVFMHFVTEVGMVRDMLDVCHQTLATAAMDASRIGDRPRCESLSKTAIWVQRLMAGWKLEGHAGERHLDLKRFAIVLARHFERVYGLNPAEETELGAKVIDADERGFLLAAAGDLYHMVGGRPLFEGDPPVAVPPMPELEPAPLPHADPTPDSELRAAQPGYGTDPTWPLAEGEPLDAEFEVKNDPADGATAEKLGTMLQVAERLGAGEGDPPDGTPMLMNPNLVWDAGTRSYRVAGFIQAERMAAQPDAESIEAARRMLPPLDQAVLQTMPDPRFDGPPSHDFLAEIKDRARRRGWSEGDYTEIVQWVIELHAEVGIDLTPADLEPYPGEE